MIHFVFHLLNLICKADQREAEERIAELRTAMGYVTPANRIDLPEPESSCVLDLVEKEVQAQLCRPETGEIDDCTTYRGEDFPYLVCGRVTSLNSQDEEVINHFVAAVSANRTVKVHELFQSDPRSS